MQKQYGFHSKLNRQPSDSRSGITNGGPSRSRYYARNQRLAEIADRAMAQPGAVSRKQRPGSFSLPFLPQVVALIMGAVAVTLAQYLRFTFAGPETFSGAPWLGIVADSGFAIAILFLLREMVSLSALRHPAMQCAGILIGVVAMHNAVHAAPDLFSGLLSQEWVQFVTATTERNTVGIEGFLMRF